MLVVFRGIFRESREVAEKGYAGFAFDAPYDTGVKA